MIKAEIRVGLHTYPFTFPGETDMAKVYEILFEVATGQEIYKGSDFMLDLNTKGYDHIKVWEEVDVEQLLQPEVEPIPDGPLRGIFGDMIEYLGNEYPFTYAVWEENGTLYILPYKIAGEPAIEAMSSDSLAPLVSAFIYAKDLSPAEVVMPHGPITDDQEAIAFVADYAAETAREIAQRMPDSKKTAKAWNWGKEPGK